VPRAALIALATIAALGPVVAPFEVGAQRGGGALDPHVDPSVIPVGCSGCHRGHGRPRSPMLGAPQKEVCLTCHGTAGQVDRLIARGVLAPGVRPTLMSSVFAKPFTHPVGERSFSRRETGTTCTSCHSPHRSMPPRPSRGDRKLSPRNPNVFEYELCLSCHGDRGPGLVNIGRLFEPHNRSYHPVQVASPGSSPSVLPELAGRAVNCTDCHGNSDRSGPRGPHGSDRRHLLRSRRTTDGGGVSSDASAFCYSCHRSKRVLAADSPFPLHRLHVVDERAACASCHGPHGSIMNRALIRLVATGGVSHSASGRLGFESTSAGQGKCYLTCHARNHDPETYGLLPEETLSTRP
jgi:predicted CXXCH cytochrome family protein